jgi:Fic family protein
MLILILLVLVRVKLMDKAIAIKKPEKAPSFGKLNNEEQNQVISLTLSGEVKEIARKANIEYLYWDRFKYRPFPESIKPHIAWFALKLNRSASTKTVPLKWSEDRLFSYWLPDIALQALHLIDQNASGNILVDVPHVQKKEKEHYLMSSLIEEAIASSMIEGAATTRKKAKEMLKKRRKPRDKAEQMILNNYLTILKIKELINEPLTPQLLMHIQELITKDTLEEAAYEGRFRKEGDDQIEIVDGSGQVLHSPPPALELPELINQLCDFANSEKEEEFVHPVLKAIIMHFWLAFIHPFMDGNGRTARALFYWYLLKKDYWLFEYLSISRIILKAPAQYYRAFLYSEIDDGDMTYFIRFHLRAINLAIKELKNHLARKQKQAVATTRRLVSHPDLNYRQKGLLTHALSHPDAQYTPQSHMQSHGVVYETARSDLLGLVKKGFFDKFKSGKGFIFIPVEGLEEKIGK